MGLVTLPATLRRDHDPQIAPGSVMAGGTPDLAPGDLALQGRALLLVIIFPSLRTWLPNRVCDGK